MTQTIQHNFPIGTELLVEGDGKHRVVDPSTLFIHSVMPEGFIATEWFEDEGGEVIDPPEADYVDPEDIKAVLHQDKTRARALDPEQEFNSGLAQFACDHQVPLVFNYAKSKRDSIQQRRVVPDLIYHTTHGDTVICGIDQDRDDVRAFRLDRIVGRAGV